jgi:hypothetical protein
MINLEGTPIKPVDVQNQKQSQRRIVECTYEVRALMDY